jgi:putative peptidoglycan lipid II flippase
MIASSIITLLSLPVYAALFHGFSTTGLVAASDLGIMVNCCTMAVLLSRRGLVAISGLDWKEIGKAVLIAIIAGAASMRVAAVIKLQGSRLSDLKSLATTVVIWGGLVALGLWVLKSKLPGELRRRKRVPGQTVGAAAEGS